MTITTKTGTKLVTLDLTLDEGETPIGLTRIEDKIGPEIEAKGLGELTGSGSGGGFRDFDFRTANPDGLVAALRRLMEDAGYRESQYRITIR